MQNLEGHGVQHFRGGLFKMRTSPNTFQGLREEGHQLIREAKAQSAFSFVTEVSIPEQVDLLADVADIYQVGSRSMYNYELLKKLSRTSKPVVLKRAFSATLEEWLSAAEYLLKDDPKKKIWLCERGVRGFDTFFRNTLDVNAIAYIAQKTPFSAMVDASHGTGRAEFVKAGSLAGIAAGATAVMVEVHPNPAEALSDAHQALNVKEFLSLKQQGDALYEHLQKT